MQDRPRRYTVKQVSEIAGVSVRTLHYYDEIDLLKPSTVGENGYRYYDDAALLRLQQILFYRELGLELLHIKDVLDSPEFDLLTALKSHRAALQHRIERLHALIDTVDETILHLGGEQNMGKKKLFKAFSEKEQKQYEREARLTYGPDNVNESIRRWESYDKKKRQAIMDEGSEIYIGLAKALRKNLPADSAEVQDLIRRWHEHIHYFYEPTTEILRGLGELYVTDTRFTDNIDSVETGLSEYMKGAINVYVDKIETRELERMLADDEEKSARG